MLLCRALALVAALAVSLLTLRDEALAAEPIAIDEVDVRGIERTERSTLTELLPRSPPASYTPAELSELQRRIRNLQLFDEVRVEPRGRVLEIVVREKFSVSPIVDLSTGKSLHDIAVTLGATENNLGGAGTRLGGYAKYSERGPQLAVWLTEHSYHPTRWQKEVEVFFTGSGFRFGDDAATWQRTRLGGDVEVKTPFRYGGSLRYELVTTVYRERLTQASGLGVPEDGMFVGVASELIWDRYTWNDTVPHGIRMTFELRPGIFVGPAQARHEARIEAIGGIDLGQRTVLAFRAIGEAVTSGNPNHSVLLGSQRGVRGLADTFYRDQSNVFGNLELRHAIELAKRWYLQPVAFVDAATFLPMNRSGTPTSWQGAFGAGGGLRLIPTILVRTLFRVDVARLFAPTEEALVQLGIDQYF